MARIQALTQSHAFERANEPTPSRFIGGMSGVSEGVPKMHLLKSSGPVFKAANLIHLSRFRSPSMRIPRLHVPKI